MRVIRVKKLRSIWAILLLLTLIVSGLSIENLAHIVNAKQEDTSVKKNEFVITEEQKNAAKDEDEKQMKYIKNIKKSKANSKKRTVVKELKKLRTSASSTYLLSDGSRKLEIYGSDKYFKKSGEYVAYDTNLKKMSKKDTSILKEKHNGIKNIGSYIYVNKSGNSKHYFPKEISGDDSILMTKESNYISFTPVIETVRESENVRKKTDISQKNSILLGNDGEKSLSTSTMEGSNKIKESNSDVNSNIKKENEDLQILDDVEVVENEVIYSDNNNLSYKYTSLTNGIKEEIILNEKTDTNIFEFDMNFSNMKIEHIEYSKGLRIVNKKTNKVVAYVSEPNITDAEGDVVYDDIDYEIEKISDREYRLKVVVSENYLNSEDTKYPIIIDPTVLWFNDKLESVSVSDFPYSLDINRKNYTIMSVHNKGIKYSPYSKSTDSSYIDTSEIDADCTLCDTVSTFYGSNVESAYLTITETGSTYRIGLNDTGTYTPGTIEVRTPVSTWNPDTLTWNNHPDMGNTVWSQFTSTGESGKTHTVNLLDWAQAVADRKIDNTGLALRCVEEGSGASFYTASIDNDDYMMLTIIYEEPHIGEKSIYSYEDFSTPNGEGKIELSQGNFLYSQADLSLPAPQLPLEVNRMYNSRNTEKSSFGIGWTCEYDSYVIPSGNKSITYVDGSKAFWVFGMQQGTNWVCNENPDLSIEIGSTSQTRVIESTPTSTVSFDSYYIITDKDRVKRYFSEEGKLQLIEEPNGTFIYIKHHNTYGFTQSVCSSKGQKIDFEYSYSGGDYYVNKIILADGSSFNYSYVNNRLIKLVHKGTDEGEIEYNYEYNFNGQLSKITDAVGNNYQLEYDGKSVASAIYPDNSRIDVYTNYEPLKTRVYTKNANNMILHYEEYVFDVGGKVLSEVNDLGNVTVYKYDGSMLINTSDKVQYHEIQSNIVKTITTTGEDGNSHLEDTIEYDERNNISREVDVEGNVTVYIYGDNNNPNLATKIKTTNIGNQTVSEIDYIYDEMGNLVKEIDYVENTVTTYVYDHDGNVTQSKDTLIEKDTDLSNVSGTIISSGLINSEDVATYDADGNTLMGSYTSGTISQTERNVYDTTGLGRLMSKSDEKNIITTYNYDEFGRVVTTTTVIPNEAPKVTSTAYDLNGRIIEEIDKTGRKTTYVYDNMGRVISKTLTYGNESKTTTTTYGYVDNFYVITGTGSNKRWSTVYAVTEKNANGEVVYQSYTDPYGRLVREESNGICSDYTYDKQGNVFTTYTRGVSSTNQATPKLVVTVYDKYGRLTDTIQNPMYRNGAFTVDATNSIVTSNKYDENGNLIEEKDAKGNKTTYTYDDEGRLIKVRLADGTETVSEAQYVYGIQNKDVSGNIISITDKTINALGNISETVMNGAGQTLSVEDKQSTNGIKTTYEYDASGNVTKEIKSDGSYFVYHYNKKNMCTLKFEYNVNNIWVKLTNYMYNDDDMLIKTVDYNVKSNRPTPYRSTIYEYDELKRLVGYSEINNSSQPTEQEINENKLVYRYDIEDKLIEIRYPKSANDMLIGIKLKYNAYKWLTKIVGIIDEDGTEVTRDVRDYEYYNDSKIKTIKEYRGFLNNTSGYIQKSYAYDLFDRVTMMSYVDSSNPSNVIEQYTYSYDKNSNIVRENIVNNYPFAHAEKVNETRIYTYDSLNRMTVSSIIDNANRTVSNTTYTYDKMGNCIQTVKNGVTTVNTYNSLNQLTKRDVSNASGRVSFTFYVYDANGNQVLEQTKVNTSTTVETIQKEYDVNNQLVKVIRREGDVNGTITYTQENTYNDAGHRISKTDNGVKTCYYYQEGVLLYTTDANGNKISQNIIGPQENIIATIRYGEDGQSVYFYNKDIRTSVTNVVDDAGRGIVSYQYDDYGMTTKYGNTDFNNDICYTSGVYDELTSLYYLNARYYNPETYTFITQDSYRGRKKEVLTLNYYLYCMSNPLTRIDSNGHDSYVFTNNQFKEESKGIKKLLKGYYNKQAHLKVISSNNNFKTQWNGIKDKKIECLVINSHANPNELEFATKATARTITKKILSDLLF